MCYCSYIVPTSHRIQNLCLSFPILSQLDCLLFFQITGTPWTRRYFPTPSGSRSSVSVAQLHPEMNCTFYACYRRFTGQLSFVYGKATPASCITGKYTCHVLVLKILQVYTHINAHTTCTYPKRRSLPLSFESMIRSIPYSLHITPPSFISLLTICMNLLRRYIFISNLGSPRPLRLRRTRGRLELTVPPYI